MIRSGLHSVDDPVETVTTPRVDTHRAHRFATMRRVAVVVLALAFLAAQVAIPLVQIVREPFPSRFSWHMFAGRRDQPTYQIVYGDGAVRSVETVEFLSNYRIELDYGDAVLLHLCRVDGQAVVIRELRADERSLREYVCP